MSNSRSQFLPLGDFLPADQWQTHVNTIFYGLKGPGIHNHFQTYVSLDHRLAHVLADEFFGEILRAGPLDGPLYVLEWGVGNGNLAARFLNRLREIDTDGAVYPHLQYILCDYSAEILKGVRANPGLQAHAGRFTTVRINAESLDCFRQGFATKIISNEIWDDLATKVLLKSQGRLFEEYLQPLLAPEVPGTEFESFREAFAQKDLQFLKECRPFLDQIVWDRNFQRVDLGDWPHASLLEAHMAQVHEDIPVPINTGAFNTLKQARFLLEGRGRGYTGFDYGMLSMEQINRPGRPYYRLFGGQYTNMVNFPLLAEVGKAVGFSNVHWEHQHQYVGRNLEHPVISVVELVQAHPHVPRMEPWEADILMLSTLRALNTAYKSPYRQKWDYPAMPGTPKKFRKQIAALAASLSATGVPDTVAYITQPEVRAAEPSLRKLGYRPRDLEQVFRGSDQPVSFGHIRFQ